MFVKGTKFTVIFRPIVVHQIYITKICYFDKDFSKVGTLLIILLGKSTLEFKQYGFSMFGKTT
jgi:hypothetical protein